MDSDDKTPDAALNVRFQMLTIYQPYDSENALLPNGEQNPNYTGTPVYKDIPHIEITTPGGLNRIVQPVRPDHKSRFPKQWAMFEMAQGNGDQIVGIKLSEWPAISRARAEELRAMKYFVVEQLAAMSDLQMQAVGMDGPMLRMKAQQFLKVAKESAIADRLSAENARKDAEIAEMKAKQEQMEKKMAELMAMGGVPKRKGRPPKVKPEPVQEAV